MVDFKESLKVTPDKIDKKAEIIKHLAIQEAAYCRNSREMSNRTNFLRSGEYVYYNIMLISGLLFSLNDTTKGILDTSIIGRVKSPESIEKKNSRQGRENKKSGDIIAFNIILDRIHNSEEFYNVFRSDKIQSLYNERKSNIDLMQLVVNFINSFEMYGLSSELDETLTVEESKEASKKRLDEMKQNCAKIQENINIYNKEDPGKNADFPINQSMRIMCEELLKREIQKAIYELIEEKENLEKEIKENKGSLSEEMLTIKKNNLRSIKAKVNLFRSRKTWKNEELVELLTGKVDKEKVGLYVPILEQLKKEDVDAMVETGDTKKEVSMEKKYCQILTLVLYQLTKLEFKKDGQYEGLVYNNIWTNLHNLLREYKNCEIDKGSYGNITFENLQKLTTNLIRLNARLSDPLQFETAKYEMDYYLKAVIEQIMGIENIEGEEKIKPNGYVSIHYDGGNFEIKVTTHYRDRVASKGSAAYGSGRIDNKNEKKREIRRLSYDKYLLKPSKRESVPKIKAIRINDALAKRIKEYGTLEKAIVTEECKEFGLIRWRKELLKSTPRYFSAKYDGNSVRIEFFGPLQNVEKYYSETSVIQIRDEVKSMIEDIRECGKDRLAQGKDELLSDETYVIEISRSQYHDFINNQLEDYKKMIEYKLKEAEKKDEEKRQGGQK